MAGVLCSMVGATFSVAAVAEIIRAKKSVSAFDNAQISTAQSQFGGASALFDGSGDYLSLLYHPDYAYGSNNFTIEFWIRFNALSTVDNKIIWDQRPVATQGAYPAIYVNTAQQIIYYANSANRCVSTTTMVTNTWYHIAVSRDSTSTKLFVNGTQEGSTYTDSTVYLTNSTETRLCQSFDAAYPDNVNGYIDELRVSNSARYTTNFTPSTTAFVNDNNTVLLLHMDGTNASQFIEDDNGVRSKKGIIANGTSKLNTTQSKFGNTSLFTPSSGGANDNLSLPFLTDLLWSESTNYTMECWVYHTAWPTGAGFPTVGTGEGSAVTFLVGRSTGFVRWCFGFNATGKLTFDYNTAGGFGGTTVQEATASGTLNAWYHIALVKQGTSVKGYVNGVEKISTTISGTVSNGTGTELPRIGGHYWSTACYYDEVRFSNIARYTTTFTPSTTRFSNDEDTVLLLHMDGENTSTFFRDDNGGNPPLNGTQFESGEYLRTTTVTNALSSSSKTATISFWIKLNNATITDFSWIWAMSTSAASDNIAGLSMYFRSTNKIDFYAYKGVANGWVMQLATPTSFLTVGEWTHIVLSYDRATAGKFACYKNGAAVSLTNTRFNNDVDGWNTATRVAIHAFAYDGSGSGSDVSIDQFWLDDTYTDLSVPGNLEKYYKNGMVDMAADGTGSGLSRPMVYHSGGPTEFANNRGRTTGTNIAYTLAATGSLTRDPYQTPLLVTSITAQANVTSTASTITIPAGAAAGDLAVLFDTSTTTTNTVPSGWTSISGQTTTGIRTNISYKILASGDPSSSITGMAGTTRKVMLVYRPNNPISSATVTVTGQQATTGTPSNQSLVGEAGPMVALASYAKTTSTTPTRGWSVGSPTEYTNVSTSGIYVKELITNSGTPGTSTISMSDAGSNTLQSFRIKFV